jgi:tRNA(Ile)-lysidine synthase
MDSMALASLYLACNIPFAVAHCNFQLRDKDADLDETFVREWCNMNGITLHHIRFQTKERSTEWKKGTQETARILRYEWFEQVRKEHGYARIATAHHANDNAETMLINLFKGTGISGLHGILPKSNHLIRPLLFATREEIAAYVEEQEIRYREDISNASDDYLRNAVRHNIVPAVEALFPNAVKSLNDSIARFADAEILYRKAIDAELKKLVEKRGQDHYIPVKKLIHRQPLATIMYELLHPYGFSAMQVPHVLNLLQSETGHYVASSTHRVIRNRDFLIITMGAQQAADLILVEAAPCKVDTGRHTFTFDIHDKPKVIDSDNNLAITDLKNISFPLVLRKWKTGDYFYPMGLAMKKKKVSKLLIGAKMALHEKEDVWVVECGRRIVWVSGLRLDERFKVKDSTEQVLVIRRTKA